MNLHRTVQLRVPATRKVMVGMLVMRSQLRFAARAVWIVVLAVGAGTSGVRCTEDGFHCCSPDQWSARIKFGSSTVSNGVYNFMEEWTTYYYDKTNQREAYKDPSQDGVIDCDRVILDYKQQKLVIVVNEAFCTQYKLQGDFQPRCTPDNASLVLFALSPSIQPLDGVFANTVYFDNDDVTGHTTVTVGNCALVEEVVVHHGHSDLLEMDVIQYFNQTLTVDESVFKIPPNCASPPYGAVDQKHARILSRLRRRRPI